MPFLILNVLKSFYLPLSDDKSRKPWRLSQRKIPPVPVPNPRYPFMADIARLYDDKTANAYTLKHAKQESSCRADVGGHAGAVVDDGGNVSNQSSHKSKVNLVIMPF